MKSENLARRARIALVDALYHLGGGHYGGSLSVMDILAVLHLDRLQRSTDDRIILSKGHAALALYAVLRELGELSADLTEYGQFGSVLAGHPDMTTTPGVAFSTGSLGQGLAAGLGMALHLRHRRSDAKVWVVLGDGECQEGQVWEAAMLASRYRVSQLHALVDANGAQEWGWTYDGTLDQDPLPSAVAKWAAFGWCAHVIDGHDHQALRDWLSYARTSMLPTVAIARTVKGRGVPSIERTQLHCGQLDPVEYRNAIEELRQ